MSGSDIYLHYHTLTISIHENVYSNRKCVIYDMVKVTMPLRAAQLIFVCTLHQLHAKPQGIPHQPKFGYQPINIALDKSKDNKNHNDSRIWRSPHPHSSRYDLSFAEDLLLLVGPAACLKKRAPARHYSSSGTYVNKPTGSRLLTTLVQSSSRCTARTLCRGSRSTSVQPGAHQSAFD